MSDVTLGVDEETMQYKYLGRKVIRNNANKAFVNIPKVNTVIEMSGDVDLFKVEEGIAFSPIYHLALQKTLSKGGIKTCLKLAKVN